MLDCPCGSENKYTMCCEPYIKNKRPAETPEVLMRSRYTAFCMADIDYIQETMRDRALLGFDAVVSKRWATRMNWIKLTILETSLISQYKGYVEFIAFFLDGYILKSIHEKSEFIQEEGRWWYVDGIQFPCKPRTISRNSVCPCSSLKKYKNCHGK